MTEKPLYQHDCTDCQYLGRYLKPMESIHDDPDAVYDLYYCPKTSGSGSVLARYGNDGPDYLSMDVRVLVSALMGDYSTLKEALIRQIEKWSKSMSPLGGPCDLFYEGADRSKHYCDCYRVGLDGRCPYDSPYSRWRKA